MRQRSCPRAISGLWLLAAVLVTVTDGVTGARAQEAASQQPAGLVAYRTSIAIDKTSDEVSAAVESASLLFTLKDEPLDAIGALFERARKDEERIKRALQALGYFSASVGITIEGGALGDAGLEDRLSEAPTDRPLAVVITIVRGPLFRIGSVKLESVDAIAPSSLDLLTQKSIGLPANAPARSADITAASASMVGQLREAGYPLATIVERNAYADHATGKLDINYRVSTGAKAQFGSVAVKGNDRVNAPFIAGLAPYDVGDPFKVSSLTDYRHELERLEVFDAITFEEAKELDQNGRLPITVNVNERPRHLLGVSTSYSTLDGLALGAYWEHRNLFGEAERLRVEAQSSRLLANGTDDYEYALSGTLTLPAFPDVRDDIVVKIGASRERPDAFSRDALELKGKLQRRFDKDLSGTLGAGFTQAHEEDALGVRDRTTFSMPISLLYDSRNNPLEATAGLRASAEVLPLINLSGSSDFATRFLGSISAYARLDSDARTVLAGRLAAGFTLASDVTDLPTDVRFFAGGGGSVRGYPYQHLSPRNSADEITGGRSLVEGSMEVRHWLWDDIGVAAFADAGGAFRPNFPDFNDVGAGVGLGLRYRTPVGPIRLDAAIPLDPRGSDSSFAVYVALGQAF